jgi:hypothetical protein
LALPTAGWYGCEVGEGRHQGDEQGLHSTADANFIEAGGNQLCMYTGAGYDGDITPEDRAAQEKGSKSKQYLWILLREGHFRGAHTQGRFTPDCSTPQNPTKKRKASSLPLPKEYCRLQHARGSTSGTAPCSSDQERIQHSRQSAASLATAFNEAPKRHVSGRDTAGTQAPLELLNRL